MKTDNYHKIQVLAGEDVSRKRVEMLVTVHDGDIHTYAAIEGPAWKTLGMTNIKGWGDLDGPAVDYDLGVCGDYTVPVCELERIVGAAAETVQTCKQCGCTDDECSGCIERTGKEKAE